MERATGYAVAELQPVSDVLLGCIWKVKETNYQAIQKKYSTAALGAVGEFTFPESVILV
jgi:hypothetical protein